MGSEPLKGEIEAGGYRFDASLLRAIATEAMRLQHKQSDVETEREGKADQE